MKKIFMIILLIPILLFGCNSSISNNPNQENFSSEPISDNIDDDWIKVEQDLQKQKELQKQVDEGHRPGLMDPIQVAAEFISDKLHHIVPEDINGLQAIKERDDPQYGKVVSYHYNNGCVIELRLNRPVKSVWAVEFYRLSEDCK